MEEMDPVVRQVNDDVVKPEPSHWYEGHISLEDAKTFIKSNITTAARSFIAIGFYLKCVRDRGLFAEDNYQDVWDFAKSEYGISKSTASRYMSMNDRFSENGNSPNIKTEYRAFGKSQLQEMLYLEDEQLEQVKPGDRVEDIRNLRRPKEIPYIELPGQMDFEIDFPDILPPDQIEQPVALQKQTFEMNVVDLLSGEGQESVAISQQNAEVNSQDFEDKRREEWLIRCEVLRQMCNTLYYMHSYGLEKDNYSMTAIRRISDGSYGFGDDGSGHSKYNVEYKKSRYHVEEFDGNGSWVFESGEIDQQIWNFNGREWHNAHPDQQKQETPQIEDVGYYNPDDEKEVDESYSYAEIPKASDRHVTMFARLFVQDNANRLIYGGMAIGITDERIIEMLKLRYSACKEDPIIIDNDVEVSVAAEIIEFYRGEEDLGICLFQKFSNCVRKQIDEYVEKQLAEEKTEENQEKNVIEQSGSVPEEGKNVPESSENVIDGKYVEVAQEQELSAQSILEEEKAELQNWIKAFQEEGLEMPPMVERQKIIVAALTTMVEHMEAPEPVNQEQPELPILKNNDQRAAFIDAYETWPIWIETKETGERYYRYDLSEKAAIVVKVYWKHSWESYKESKDYEYGAQQYYLMGVKSEWHNGKNVYVEDESRSFYECGTNRSALVDYLKEFQKSK